jgi:hypothetical protein
MELVVIKNETKKHENIKVKDSRKTNFLLFLFSREKLDSDFR